MTGALTPQQHQTLADRIRTAETRTSGEIYCVVARVSDGYFHAAAFTLALGIGLAGLPVALWLDRSWLSVPHLAFVATQAAAYAASLLLLIVFPRLRIRFVPRRLRYARAHDNAVRQFLAHNIHRTERRTGVLIFVSLAERYAEVVADAGIDGKVGQAEWDGVVERIVAAAAADRLYEGLADAIDRSATLLAEHFPGGDDDPNELADHVVEI